MYLLSIDACFGWWLKSTTSKAIIINTGMYTRILQHHKLNHRHFVNTRICMSPWMDCSSSEIWDKIIFRWVNEKKICLIYNFRWTIISLITIQRVFNFRQRPHQILVFHCSAIWITMFLHVLYALVYNYSCLRYYLNQCKGVWRTLYYSCTFA